MDKKITERGINLIETRQSLLGDLKWVEGCTKDIELKVRGKTVMRTHHEICDDTKLIETIIHNRISRRIKQIEEELIELGFDYD
ncbi:TPA: hypothetical protein ACOAY7_002806 [Vibrio cholerae]